VARSTWKVTDRDRPRSGLPQSAFGREGIADIVRSDAVDAGDEPQLGRARHLRLETDHRADDIDHSISRGAFEQVLAREPEPATCDQVVVTGAVVLMAMAR
jgi:hypothetical protein